MSKTNCINCGAAKELSDAICPFCGTKYADFTTFDVMSSDPIYIQIRNREGQPVTAKAYVTNRELHFQTIGESYARDINGMMHRKKPVFGVNGKIEFVLYEGRSDV